MEKIEVTKGTDMIPLVFNITDFQIPKTASATAYITGTSGKTKKKLCDVVGNRITLEPTSDLFSVGNNDIQIRIVDDTKTLVTFNTNCYCENSVEFGDAAEEKEQTLIEQLLASQGKIQTGLNNEVEERTKLLNEQNEKINKINTDKIDKTGNAGSTTVEFEESGIRENVETGETMAIIIGKIAKWFKDLKSGAFAEVANDLVTTVEGKVLDARQGKVLEEKITDLNSKLSNKVNAPRLSVNAETLTGEYFAGKPVYAKIIDIGTMPNNTTKTIGTGIEGAGYFWIDTSNSMVRNGGASYPIPYADPAQSASDIAVRLYDGGKTLAVWTKTDWSGYSAFVTIKYTKL